MMGPAAEGESASRGTAGGEIESPIPDFKVTAPKKSVCLRCGHEPPHLLFPGFICGSKDCPMYTDEDRAAHAAKIRARGKPLTVTEVMTGIVESGGTIEAVSEECLDLLLQEAAQTDKGGHPLLPQSEAPNPKVQEEWEEVYCPCFRGMIPVVETCDVCNGHGTIMRRRLNTSKERQVNG